MRVDCNAVDVADGHEHRCPLEPGHYGPHLCWACRHVWANQYLVLKDDLL